MARCGRCGAEAAWLIGDPPKLPRDEEVRELRDTLDATRARLAEAEARWNATAGTTQRDYADLQEQAHRYSLALAASQASERAAREALYPLVVGCFTADAHEDAPEFVNGEAERGRDALPKCGRCDGCGALDLVEYVDVVIPEAVRCPDCGGWGFLAHAPGDDAALRALLVDVALDAWINGAVNYRGEGSGVEVTAPSREYIEREFVSRVMGDAQRQGEGATTKEGGEG